MDEWLLGFTAGVGLSITLLVLLLYLAAIAIGREMSKH